MRNIIRLSIFSFLIALVNTASAQEFELEVKVGAPGLSMTNENIVPALQKQLYEFYNSNTWTEDTYQDHERIRGNIQLTIKEELSPTSFRGQLVVQTSRPIYNSNTSTPIMKYVDKNLTFAYDGLQNIRISTDGYADNFSSILSFFAYFMLGMDYDSFSPMGGDPFFDQAFSLYNGLPASIQRGDGGWTQDDKRQQNRYFLIENVRSPKFRRMREAMYSYHRKGMDKMHSDFNEGRAVILEAITDVGRVNKEINNTILPQMFADTKRLEIVDIFITADADQKTKIRSIMLSIDPSQTIAYKDLR
ncbi:MAG: hypothetical protein ACI86M_000005 [Saprospiraceae bacterium]|jgi:hypothetical protein